MKRKWLAAAAALMGGAGIAASAGVLPAVGQSSPPASPVIIGHAAKIVARGAAVKPFAYVVCQPGDYVSVQISITERVGRRIAAGSGSESGFACNGLIEKVTVPVTATQAPFVKGIAYGQAVFTDCNYEVCGTAQSQGKVKLFS
jgi:hypothetical protein